MIKTSNYLIYGEGNTNLILSAPHTGSIKPPFIPTRSKGIVLRDTFSKEVIRGLLSYFNFTPSFVYAGIHRSKVDLNRDISEGCGGNPDAEKIWKTWNSLLVLFAARQRGHKALYVDIHSHNNSDEVQLGYAINRISYDTICNGGNITGITSLDELGHSPYRMICGRNSLKSLLERRGVQVYDPKPNEQYFDGGYNIRQFWGVGVGSIQIEIPVSYGYNNKLDVLIKALGESITIFKRTFVD